MSNYIKGTNFALKDNLPPGDSGKIVKGTEIDVEFVAIAAAIASKPDANSPTLTGTPLAPTAPSGTNDTQIATTAFVQNALSTGVATPTITGGSMDGAIIGATTPAAITGTTITSTLGFTGDLTGNVTGNVTGNLTGNVTGNVSGSAGSATTATTAGSFTSQTGSAPSYAARAWVNFNGSGVVAIRAAGNVSSITDVGTGNYIVNLTTAIQDSLGCPAFSMAQGGSTGGADGAYRQVVYMSSSSTVVARMGGNSAYDQAWVHVTVFR